MYCPNCGNKIDGEVKRCPHCLRLVNRLDNDNIEPTVLMPKPPRRQNVSGEKTSHIPTISPQKTTDDTLSFENAQTTRTENNGKITFDTDAEEERLKQTLKNHYTIKLLLRKGNMATVYLAHELSLDRDVAIKVLPCEMMNDLQFFTRFQREAKLTAKLEHPSIVRIFQFGQEDGFLYIVMSYIPGGSLTQYLSLHGALPIQTALLWGLDITSALAYAHEQGIIHSDLKPDNIMIDKNNRAVVMDFGIARAIQDPKMTLSGLIIGTPRYMSPEQALGSEADARSDIYTVGLILYEMITNKFPFEELANINSYLYNHVNTPPKPPNTYKPDIPGWLSAAILKCLSKKPEDRFSNLLELRDEMVANKPEGVPMATSSVSYRIETPPVSEKDHVIPWKPMQKYDLNPSMFTYIQKVIEQLPNLPLYANRLIRMMADDTVEPKEISKIVAVDPVVVTHILNVVNSSYYGLSKKTSNLHFAIVRLGLNEVRRIILKHFLNKLFSKIWTYEKYTTQGLWVHSYITSVCTEYFAKRYAPKQVGNLVTYSLMHDIGKFSLFEIKILMKQKGIALKTVKNTTGLPPLQVEEYLFRVNHAILGGMVAQKWGLPERTCDIIEHHHNPSYLDFSSIPEDIIKDVILVNISDIIVHRVTKMPYNIPEPEPEFFELVNLKYPLERNITNDVRQTITKAIDFVKSLN